MTLVLPLYLIPSLLVSSSSFSLESDSGSSFKNQFLCHQLQEAIFDSSSLPPWYHMFLLYFSHNRITCFLHCFFLFGLTAGR